MKRYLIILVTIFIVPTIGKCAEGDRIYISPLYYTITKEVVVHSSSTYTVGEVMVGIKDGWIGGHCSGNITINNPITYNGYHYYVSRIGKEAFRDYTKITSITMPNTIGRIEEEAFKNCTSLKNVTITQYSDNVTSNTISTSAFIGCNSLETVDFSGSTLYVGANAFLGCSRLQSFPFDKVPTINNSSFSGCEALSEITLSTQNIGDNAFENCTSLSSVTFTGNKVNIGSHAFEGCRRLKKVTCYMDKENFTSLSNDNCFSEISPRAVLYVPNGMVSCYENDEKWHAAFPNIKAIAPSLGDTFSANIPVGNGTMKLTFEVTDVDKMEVVITSSESEINSQIDLVIPEEISYQDWHFSIVGIGSLAFTNIHDIHSVTVGWRQPVAVADNFNIVDDAVLYVPAGTKHRYETVKIWQEFSQIKEVSPISVGDISSLVGSNVSLPIVLNNTEVIEGVQFKLTLPKGVSVKEVDGELNTSLTSRTEGMTTMGRKDPDSENSYLFLLFSWNGNSIIGNEGAILNINLEIAPDTQIGKSDMTIEDIHMTTSTFNTLYPAAASSELLVYTNVRNIDFADTKTKALCIYHWDMNEDDELDTSEAAIVNSLDDVFKGNGEITTFNELQYFTGLTTIGQQDFSGCYGLSSVFIPCNVTDIEKGAFNGCNNLRSIIVDENNNIYDSRNNSNAIIKTGTNTLIYGCMNTIIPNSVETIGLQAFENCPGLTSIDIPNSVTSIEENAFYGCYALTTVNIQNGVATIGEGAFSGCIGLTTVNIPESVTTIGERAFYGCIGLTTVNIPESVTTIGGSAFSGCVGLTAVNIPESVITIGERAFYNCIGLTTLTIPNSVTNIGEESFNECSGLTTIIVDENNKNYDSRNNSNAIIETGSNTLILGCANTLIPNSVTTIGKAAFVDNNELTKVIIPSSVTSIGEQAFFGCKKLTMVKLKSITPIDIQENVFSNRSKATLYVPIGGLDNYMASNYWNEFNALKTYPNADVNQDENIDVKDVVDIARFVVGTPRTIFDEYLADLNNDDLTNVADAVALVNLIAGDVNFESRRSAKILDSDELKLTENVDHSLSLSLDGDGQYTAFQFDIILPNDLDIANISLNNQRKQKHQLLYNKVSNNMYRVIALSTSNRMFLGTAGELVNITIDDCHAGDVLVDNIHFVTVQGHDKQFNSINLNGSSSTGIDEFKEDSIKKDQLQIYNLSGLRIAVPQKGFNIVGGKKVLVK